MNKENKEVLVGESTDVYTPVRQINPTNNPRKCMWEFFFTVSLSFIVIGVFFALNCFQPLAGDDFGYCFHRVADGYERVTSLQDVCDSAVRSWYRTNGRLFTNSMAQLYLMFDKTFFNVINTGIFFGFACLLYIITRVPGRHRMLLASSVIAIIVLAFVPLPGETLIWLDGSCNYLWPMFICTLFLALLFSGNKYMRLAALMLAFVVGNSHESFSVGLVGFLVAYVAIRINTCRRDYLMLAATLLVIVGVLSNLCSPGLQARASYATSSLSGGLGALFEQMCSMGMTWVLSILSCSRDYLPSCILALCGLGILIAKWRNRLDRQNILAICFLFACMLQAVFVLASGMFYPRVTCGVFYFALLAFLVYFVPWLQRTRLPWILAIIIAVISVSVSELLQVAPQSRLNHQRMQYIENCVRNGCRIVVLPDEYHVRLSCRYQSYGFWSPWGDYPCHYELLRAALLFGANKSFCVLTPKQYKKLASMSPSELAEAELGGVVKLTDTDIFVFLPDSLTRIRWWSHYRDVNGRERVQMKHNPIACPFRGQVGCILSIPENSTRVEIESDVRIELDDKHMSQLREVGVVAAQDIIRTAK